MMTKSTDCKCLSNTKYTSFNDRWDAMSKAAPFNGGGTTGVFVLQHGRKYLGIELNPEYVKLTHDRLAPVLNDLFREVPA